MPGGARRSTPCYSVDVIGPSAHQVIQEPSVVKRNGSETVKMYDMETQSVSVTYTSFNADITGSATYTAGLPLNAI
jgi:hypothetical protein